MYARSYEKNAYAAEEEARTLPSGYCGVAFEGEGEPPPAAPETVCVEGEGKTEEPSPVSLFFSKLPFLQKLRPREGSLVSSFFSSTEDILLIGIFLLLLLSKEGDPLCAVAVLILFFSDKF